MTTVGAAQRWVTPSRSISSQISGGSTRRTVTWVAPAPAQCGTTTTTTSSTTTTTLRFVDNGDGTVTDHQTGLIWEKKVAGSSCLHCVDDSYNWSFSGAAPDGLAFTSFLNTLNGGATGAGNCVSPDGSSITGGFNGHCDWRLPSIVELQTIVDLSATGCPRSPCIDPIFGPTGGADYWSSTTDTVDSGSAWYVDFVGGGHMFYDFKTNGKRVRAVRGGS